jgi:hypothetical protein
MRPGPVGFRPSFSRVCALEAGTSRPTKAASQPECLEDSSGVRETTGTFRPRPMASAMSRTGTPLPRPHEICRRRPPSLAPADTAGQYRGGEPQNLPPAEPRSKLEPLRAYILRWRQQGAQLPADSADFTRTLPAGCRLGNFAPLCPKTRETTLGCDGTGSRHISRQRSAA